jgi:hypothetical protein
MTSEEKELRLTAERKRVLARFGKACSEADLDTLVSLMTEDCIYSASVGPEPGRTFLGRAAVREGFSSMLAYDDAGVSRGGRSVVGGDIGISEWSYLHHGPNETVLEVRGCDIFEFRGFRILKKDAFRKCFPFGVSDARLRRYPSCQK